MSDDPAQRQALEMTEPGETSADPVAGTLDDVGDLRLGTVVVNTQDMPRALRFWSRALAIAGARPSPTPHSPCWRIRRVPGRRSLCSSPIMLRSSGCPGPVHGRAGAPDRAAGRARAVRAEDRDHPDAPELVVLRDLDGNELCVVGHPAG